MQETDEGRIEAITEIYREILGREPDAGGLKAYSLSTLSIDQIRTAILGSTEAQEKLQAKGFKQRLSQLDQRELMVMGSTPTEQEHVNALVSIGIKCVLDLNDTYEVRLDTSGFDSYLNVPISKYSLLSTQQIDKCFAFIYQSVLVEKKKLFLHSKAGRERPPTIMALFLAAEKSMPYKVAISMLMDKHESINPSRDIISASILEYVCSLRGKMQDKYGGGIVKSLGGADVCDNHPKCSVVQVIDNLYCGLSLNDESLKYMKANGIDTIIDMNPKPLKVTSEFSWFKKLHLPLFVDQISYVLPTVLRSLNKYVGKGKVLIVCEDKGMVSMVVDKYLLEYTDKDPVVLDKARTSLMSI